MSDRTAPDKVLGMLLRHFQSAGVATWGARDVTSVPPRARSRAAPERTPCVAGRSTDTRLARVVEARRSRRIRLLSRLTRRLDTAPRKYTDGLRAAEFRKFKRRLLLMFEKLFEGRFLQHDGVWDRWPGYAARAHK
jgi:hypothetical protein